ncbi:MAG TPA: enoyl-CoA hydratase/isomerase family protein [Arenimonas sp.]|uniref:enoyl-CoA hydratase/isomerase family protein n=1 Tax=Arenimonas sp. TaxID=1872635 RepID=UPI002C52939E|nr:enoyl-CoA hydratase/isomerase family protein [Arenimonas sp.]HMB56063.1 enoyl-CoA hydratase/isomerase family protein [Arenimonas sp.]
MIEINKHGDIHELRLSRPPVNALNNELLSALIAAITAAPGQGARALILSGGEKVFSGGLDVPYLMTLDRAGLASCWSQFFDASRALAKSPIPVVAAIAGHNPAGGCVLALCCDYRIMARGPFRIGLNETQVGLAVPDAIQYLMRRVTGAHRAERLIVAGAMIESEQALALGVVDELTDAGDVVTRSLRWLEELLTLPNSPMLATRAIARADVIRALDGFGDADLQRFLDGWYSTDTQAALQALMARLKK